MTLQSIFSEIDLCHDIINRTKRKINKFPPILLMLGGVLEGLLSNQFFYVTQFGWFKYFFLPFKFYINYFYS